MTLSCTNMTLSYTNMTLSCTNMTLSCTNMTLSCTFATLPPDCMNGDPTPRVHKMVTLPYGCFLFVYHTRVTVVPIALAN